MSPRLDFSKFWVKDFYQLNPSSSELNSSVKKQKEKSKLLEELANLSLDSSIIIQIEPIYLINQFLYYLYLKISLQFSLREQKILANESHIIIIKRQNINKRSKMRSKQKPSSSQRKQQRSTDQVAEYQPNLLTKQLELSSLIGFKCVHISFFICWVGLVIAGTTIIGFQASNYTLTNAYCDEGQPFCFYDVTLDANRDLSIYTKLHPFNQNNRMYLDAYSYKQLSGQNGTGSQCGSYKYYKNINKYQTVGGYRVTGNQNVHPCGIPMLSLFNDSVYVVKSDGGTPNLDNDIKSNYSKLYRFKRLANYATSQWIDVQSSRFIDWFTVPATSTKYVLMGRLVNMTTGDYRVIVKNSYPTNGEFTKELFISEVNSLGVTNHLLGFTIFAYGIGMLLAHVGICCKSKD